MCRAAADLCISPRLQKTGAPRVQKHPRRAHTGNLPKIPPIFLFALYFLCIKTQCYKFLCKKLLFF